MRYLKFKCFDDNNDFLLEEVIRFMDDGNLDDLIRLTVAGYKKNFPNCKMVKVYDEEGALLGVCF